MLFCGVGVTVSRRQRLLVAQQPCGIRVVRGIDFRPVWDGNILFSGAGIKDDLE
jgi:hypothetical protein